MFSAPSFALLRGKTRRVLDQQLQDTIHQFEHVHGVVQRIDEDSTQLAEALTGQQARIIITTLQKFPYVTDKIDSLPDRTYAVIVDEAHSSQTGESATKLKEVLGSGARRRGAGQADRSGGGCACRCRGGPGQAAQPVVLCVHRHTKGPHAGAVRSHGPLHWAARAVSPVLDASGDRGGVHPRRAGQLRHLQDLLEHREHHAGRPRLRPGQGPRGDRQVCGAARAHAGPEGRGDRRALPGERRPSHRGHGQGDGGDVVAGARRPLRAGAAQVRQRQGLHRRWGAGGVLGHVGPGRWHRDRVVDERLPRQPDPDRVRRRRVADPGGGREVPDRVRPAEAVCDVRRQAAERPGRRADAVAPQPHLRPGRDPQGRHLRAGLPQRRRRHPGGVRALVRRDGGAAHRPQPALRHPPCARRVWGAVARGDRADRRPAAGQGPR
jgi:hypothetical protein